MILLTVPVCFLSKPQLILLMKVGAVPWFLFRVPFIPFGFTHGVCLIVFNEAEFLFDSDMQEGKMSSSYSAKVNDSLPRIGGGHDSAPPFCRTTIGHDCGS